MVKQTYAVINVDKVVNVIALEDITSYTTPFTLIQSDIAKIGDLWDGENFVTPVVIQPPDYNNFGLGLFSNSAFNRIANSSGDRVGTSTLISIGTSVINSGTITDMAIATIPTAWNGMIDGTPQDSKPTTEDIAGWNAIAVACNMTFTFVASGKIEPQAL